MNYTLFVEKSLFRINIQNIMQNVVYIVQSKYAEYYAEYVVYIVQNKYAEYRTPEAQILIILVILMRNIGIQ